MKIKNTIITLLLGLFAISSFSQKIVWESKASLPYNTYSGSAVTCHEVQEIPYQVKTLLWVQQS